MDSIDNIIISLFIKPNIIVNNVLELTSDELDYLKTFGIKGLILDVDETLRYNMKMIDNDTFNWLIMAKSKMAIAVVSNGYDMRIEETLRLLKIPYYKMAFKPSKKYLLQALNTIGIKPEESLIIGDDYLSDILGGYRTNINTCLVRKRGK